MIERRVFLGAASLAVLATCSDVTAQPARGAHRIGFLGGASASGYARFVDALVLGLRDHGYVLGKNVAIEYRWAEGQYERLPALAAELIRLKVDLIVTQGTPAAFAAKRATPTIPIVMAIVGNPVESGIVASYARPGGNITGSLFFWSELNAKRIEFMKLLIPDLARVGALVNPDNPATGSLLRAMEERARALKMSLEPVKVRRLEELEDAFQQIRKQLRGLAVVEDGLFLANAGRIADLAVKHRMPTIGFEEYCEAGGLLAYGVDLPHIWRQAGVLVDKIFKGEAGGLADPAGDAVRTGAQREGREGPGVHGPAGGAEARGPADPQLTARTRHALPVGPCHGSDVLAPLAVAETASAIYSARGREMLAERRTQGVPTSGTLARSTPSLLLARQFKGKR